MEPKNPGIDVSSLFQENVSVNVELCIALLFLKEQVGQGQGVGGKGVGLWLKSTRYTNMYCKLLSSFCQFQFPGAAAFCSLRSHSHSLSMRMIMRELGSFLFFLGAPSLRWQRCATREIAQEIKTEFQFANSCAQDSPSPSSPPPPSPCILDIIFCTQKLVENFCIPLLNLNCIWNLFGVLCVFAFLLFCSVLFCSTHFPISVRSPCSLQLLEEDEAGKGCCKSGGRWGS